MNNAIINIDELLNSFSTEQKMNDPFIHNFCTILKISKGTDITKLVAQSISGLCKVKNELSNQLIDALHRSTTHVA